MSGSLKSYFYFVCRTSTAANGLQQDAKAFCVVRNSEDICQAFTFLAEDEAVVLVLRTIDTHTNHKASLRYLYLLLVPLDTLLL